MLKEVSETVNACLRTEIWIILRGGEVKDGGEVNDEDEVTVECEAEAECEATTRSELNEGHEPDEVFHELEVDDG